MSSPASFVTAHQTMRSSLLTPDDSSPPCSEPELASDDFSSHHSPASLERPTKPLTYELRNHSTVYLEQAQYLEAFTLLNSLLVAGNSISTPGNLQSAFVPPAQYLALATTLVVSPSLTTKAKSFDRQKDSNSALSYLRNLSGVVDPTSDNISHAFTFGTQGSTRRAGRYRGVDLDSPNGDVGERKITNNNANAGSVWNRAEDFWHIVGWAFNCSVTCKPRWERWRLWLELILDFVEADWNKRRSLALDEEDFTSGLIWQYVASQDPQSRTTRRRILRAILADGTPKPMKEFTEVFKDETKERKKDEEAEMKIRKPLDIENDEFGDYDFSEDEDAVATDIDRTSTRPSRKAARQQDSHSSETSSDEDGDFEREDRSLNPVERLGGMDAIKLRQRLLYLLVEVAAATEDLNKKKKNHLPAPFSTVEDLFDLYTECFRPLPTSVFSIILSTSLLEPEAQAKLNTTLLLPILPTNSAKYFPLPNQSQLEEHYLPFGANTHSYGDNAKISLVLESLLVQMMDNHTLKPSKEFRKAVEEGIAAREQRAYGDARKKQHRKSEEAAAKDILKLSQERLLGLVEVLELSFESPPRRPSNTSTQRGLSQSISSPLSSAISFSSAISVVNNDADAMEP